MNVARPLAATLALLVGAAFGPMTASAQGPPAVATLDTGYFEVSYDPGGPDYSVVLRGTVNPRGQPTRYYFEYGTTTAYGQRRPADPGGGDAGSGAVPKEVSNSISGLGDGLQQDVTYHYRVVAVNASGTTFGADRTFRVTGVLRPPSRLGYGVGSRTARATRIRFLVLSDTPRGTSVTVRRCGRGGCKVVQRFVTTRRKHRFFRNKVLGAGASAEVEARQPNGYGVLTKLRVFRGGVPVRSESCLAPGRKPTKCLAISVFSLGPRIRSVRVLSVTDFARVEVRCRGGGCPFRAKVRRTGSISSSRDFAFRGLGKVRPGAVIQVYVTRLNTVGTYQRIVVGRRSVSRGAYRCIQRGSLRRLLRTCPEGQVLGSPFG